MGSIRPLVTITILVVVGAYLYVKINEGPTPHAGAANALNPSLAAANAKGTSLAADNTAPAWPSTAGTSAPPSSAVAPGTPSANQPLPPASTTASTSGTPKDGMPAVPAIPELPPLPTMNDPSSSAQQNIQLPKDLPANNPIALHPDQPGAAATGAKDATGAASPGASSSTDPSKASAPPLDPRVSVAAPVVPPATSSTSTPATPTNGSLAPVAPAGATTTDTTSQTQAAAQNPLRGSAPTTPPVADPNDRYANPSTTPATVPTPPSTASATPTTPIGVPDGSSFAASWPAIQAALDRRDLKQAHQLLSKWHGNESLSPTDTQKVETLLSQLAGTVIYSTEHQLEPARIVKPGETLESISKEYNVPPQLLGKINGVQSGDQLKPGQQLKVVRGPFSAVIDARHNELTLMVDDRYAGKFPITVPQGTALADGQWLVDQKLSGPAAPSAYATPPAPADRSIVLRSATSIAAGAPTLVIASGAAQSGAAVGPPSVRVSPQDAAEISDILSVGSRVVVRK
jgi:LysM repeat protein